jgi:predicted ribosome quality control (RQC) complex YloA/Tae2 family protein
VQDVLQPGTLSLALELYAGRRRYLTLSADPELEGIGLDDDRVRRGTGAPTPLTLSAAARLEGARLTAVNWPADERLLFLEFSGAADTVLIAEPMGRMANVVLTDDAGVVIACARPVTRAMTRARTVLPGSPYERPPPQAKTPAAQVRVADVEGWLAPETGAAWRVLVRHVRGMSPLAAREIVHRAAGDAEARSAGALAQALAEETVRLFDAVKTGQATPTIARSGGRVRAYAAHDLRHLEGAVSAPTMAAAIASYEAERLGDDPYRDARDSVRAEVGVARSKVERRLRALRWSVSGQEDPESLQQKGDLILTFQRQVGRGDTELEATFDPDAPPVAIRLDPRRSPVENARSYYARAKKARRAAAALPARIASGEAELEVLDQLLYDVDSADDRADIDAVHDALAEAGYGARPARRRRTAGTPPGPLRLEGPQGFTLWVGRNSRQNETVTFVKAARGDVWLHAQGVPGAHVVVKAAGREVPETVIEAAAAVAAWHSRARDDAVATVIVADPRHVRRAAGGQPGRVRVDQLTTLNVRPKPPEVALAPEGGS